MSDQIEKLKERAVGVKVLKEDDQFVNQSIDDPVKFVYCHAEAFLGNQSVLTPLRSFFRNRVIQSCAGNWVGSHFEMHHGAVLGDAFQSWRLHKVKASMFNKS